jgi:hypothetical protein
MICFLSPDLAVGLTLQKVVNRQGVDLLEVTLPKDAIYVLSRRIRLGWVCCWCRSLESHPASVSQSSRYFAAIAKKKSARQRF